MFGPYRLDGLIGRGGMGEVYRAVDTKQGHVVALKRLPATLGADAKFLDRFRREVSIAAQLRAPHVVPIKDYGEINGQPFLAMQLITGTDLDKLLADHGPLRPARAVAIITQVAGALDAAHSQGLVHRDVKPSNVLLTHDDFAYLTDFGVARKLAGGTTLTVVGDTVGTPTYTAPERFLGRPSNHLADVYALACVLYESLTGQPPFVANDVDALMYAHVNVPPPQASRRQQDVPPALDEVIARGMAKDPAQRFSSAGELARAAAVAVRQPHPVPLDHRVRPKPAAVGTVHWRVPGRLPPDDPPAESDRRTRPRWPAPITVALIVALIALALIVTPVVLLVGLKPGIPAETITARLTLSASQVPVGKTYSADAAGFSPGEGVLFTWTGPTSGKMGVFPTNPDGNISHPIDEKDPPGDYTITATGLTSGRTASAGLHVMFGTGSPALVLSKSQVVIDDSFYATAWGFLPGEDLAFSRVGPAGTSVSVNSKGSVVSVDSTGGTSLGPVHERYPPGDYTITVVGQTSGRSASAIHKVVADSSPGARLVLSTSQVAVGPSFFKTALGFLPGESVKFSWTGPTSGTNKENVIVDSYGICWVKSWWEKDAPAGNYTIIATGQTSGRSASAGLQVIRLGN